MIMMNNISNKNTSKNDILNITSRLIVSDDFVRDVKKYKNKIFSFLSFVQKNLYLKGLSFLVSKKNEKMLSNTATTVFEFRSLIKGHRLLFKYGWQYNNININDNDIVLCRYVNDHDRISEEANSISDNFSLNQEWTDKLNISDFEIQELQNSETLESNKLYYYTDNVNYLMPILNREQEKILKDKEQYVFVNGIAGSGKTNLCIQKMVMDSCCGNKVLYSTFSESLLNSTQETIHYNYIDQLRLIKNELDLYGLNESLILKINNLNLNFSLTGNYLESIDAFQNKLKTIKYKMLCDIYNEKYNLKKELVTFKIFSRLFESNQMLTFDLKNKFKDTQISLEILFKEIEGVVLGLNSTNPIISFEDYKTERKSIFDEKSLVLIYDIAKEYLEFISKSDKFADKNLIAVSLIKDNSLKEYYDVIVLDEVQDFTQKELLAFKHMSKKVFAVGDPLQMINPSYFSFNRLKQLYGENHKEYILDLNYRNTKQLNHAINDLIEINRDKLGNHSNILKNIKTADIQESTYLFFTNQKSILDGLNASEFNDYSIVVATDKEKDIKCKKEVLTISEVKGLERGTIILYNILSQHLSEWLKLENSQINKKLADENSLLRYYFNIFYVGITRAQRHLLIVEESEINIFRDFFKNNFTYLNKDTPIDSLQLKLDLKTLSLSERIHRINESLKNKLFDNALHYISWIKDEKEKQKQMIRYEIYKDFYKENSFEQSINKCLEFDFIDDAIEISKQSKNYDVANLLNKIFVLHDFDMQLCYEVLSKTNSINLKSIIQNTLETTRKDLIEKNKLLQEILKEI